MDKLATSRQVVRPAIEAESLMHMETGHGSAPGLYPKWRKKNCTNSFVKTLLKQLFENHGINSIFRSVRKDEREHCVLGS